MKKRGGAIVAEWRGWHFFSTPHADPAAGFGLHCLAESTEYGSRTAREAVVGPWCGWDSKRAMLQFLKFAICQAGSFALALVEIRVRGSDLVTVRGTRHKEDGREN
jgi:hypothetical protein